MHALAAKERTELAGARAAAAITMRSFSAAVRLLPLCMTRSDGRSFVIGTRLGAVRSQRESWDCETPTSFDRLIAEIALGDDIRCTIFALKLSV